MVTKFKHVYLLTHFKMKIYNVTKSQHQNNGAVEKTGNLNQYRNGHDYEDAELKWPHICRISDNVIG